MKNEEQQIKTLQTVLSDIKNASPVLLVGGATTLFKRMFKGNIEVVTNTKEVRDFIEEHRGVSYNRPIIVSDLGSLSDSASFLLLKLIEESTSPIIVLSTIDKVDGILLSRFKNIVKFPIDENTSSELLSPASAIELMENEPPLDRDKFLAEKSPSLYKIESEIPFTKNRDRYIQLLVD